MVQNPINDEFLEIATFGYYQSDSAHHKPVVNLKLI
jgi:hypothetical protein